MLGKAYKGHRININRCVVPHCNTSITPGVISDISVTFAAIESTEYFPHSGPDPWHRLTSPIRCSASAGREQSSVRLACVWTECNMLLSDANIFETREADFLPSDAAVSLPA